MAVALPPAVGRRRGRRAALKCGASARAVRVLLAVPLVVSVGVALSRPAHAQTALPPSDTTVFLPLYGTGDNPFVIGGGTLISTGGAGIFGVLGAYTISNFGTVLSSGSTGIFLAAGGTVVNLGTVRGADLGGYDGILIAGGAGGVDNQSTVAGYTGIELVHGGTVRNSGIVDGDTLGVFIAELPGSVLNSGTILSSNAGQYGAAVALDGGYLSNASVGVISGVANGALVNSSFALIHNDGTISGTGEAANGAWFVAAGSLENAGLLSGTGRGVYMETGGDIKNTGSILGGEVGVSISGGLGVVHNNGFADADYISGASAGVVISSAGGTLVNRGLITQSTDQYGDAAVIMDGGYLYNQGSNCANNLGVIAGYSGGVLAQGEQAISIVNAGTITGDAPGTEFNDAGIHLGAGGGTIVNEQSGFVYSYNGDAVYSQAGGFALFNAGSIVGWFDGVSSYGPDASAAGPVTIVNAGTIKGIVGNGIYVNTGYASISNRGVIVGEGNDEDGIVLAAGGSVLNAGLIGGYQNGILGFGDPISVSNAGTILGYFGSGLALYSGAKIFNAGTIGGGYDGIFAENEPISVANGGTIFGLYGTGIRVEAGATVANGGLIVGRYAGVYAKGGGLTLGNSGTIIGRVASGVEIYAGGTVMNSGLIAGKYDGIFAANDPVTIANDGLIKGSLSSGVVLRNAGTVFNAGGPARGTISGAYDGVYISGGYGSVVNGGLITASKYDGVYLRVGGTLLNESGGLIAGHYSGVQIGYALERTAFKGHVVNAGTIVGNNAAGVVMYGGGYFGNLAGGTVWNESALGFGVAMYTPNAQVYNAGWIRAGRQGQGVRLYNGGTIFNNGEISTGIKGVGVYLRDGGELFNSGYVYGGFGVQGGAMGAAYVENIGQITGHTVGVQLLHGGYVNNAYFTRCDGLHTGSIYGRQIGVQISGVAGSVNNYGYIGGGGVQTYGIGVDLTHGGAVTNESEYYDGVMTNGTIVGGDTGVRIDGQGGYVYNTGLIKGGSIGVALGDGGFVANTTYTAGGLTAFGTIRGSEYGVYAGTLVRGTVFNSGSIVGRVAVGLLGGGGVTNATGGDIDGDSAGVLILNRAGYVSNAGLIEGFYGAALIGGGTVVNQSGGDIGGAFGVETGYFNEPISVRGTVINAGFIEGDYVGVIEHGGGSLVNQAGGVILGGSGAYIYGPTLSASHIVNAGNIIGEEESGVVLRGPGSFALANQTGGTISGIGYGVEAQAGRVDLTNAGLIVATGAGVYIDGPVAALTNGVGGVIVGGSDYGVQFHGVASVNLLNAGSIHGGYIGILADDILAGDMLNITNQAGGVITGGSDGYGIWVRTNSLSGVASITNAGHISSPYEGILVHGGVADVINQAGGSISGDYVGVVLNAGANFVANAGLIASDEADDSGVYEQGSYASLINQETGTIKGYDYGAYLSTGEAVVDNAGLIEAFGDGEYRTGLYVEGTLAQLTNEAGGTISGGLDGVHSEAALLSLANAGLISSEDIALAAYGTVDLAGNQAGGTITGYEGVELQGGSIDVLGNAGLVNGADIGADLAGSLALVIDQQGGAIIGGQAGVLLSGQDGYLENAGLIQGTVGIGVNLQSAGIGKVVNEAGATLAGASYGIESEAASFTLVNAGLVAGASYNGVLANGSGDANIINAAGGTITGRQDGVLFLDNSSAYLQNAGFIAGGETGADLLDEQGNAINLATGTISGGFGLFTEGSTVFNAGLIEGTDYAGVGIYYGGVLSNAGSITGAIYGAYIGNKYEAVSNAGTVFNDGLIAGGSVGLVLYNGGSIENMAGGTIQGGVYGVQTNYFGSSLVSLGTVVNAGLISGGVDGVYLAAGGAVSNLAGGTLSGGVAGVYSAGALTLANAGLISGGEVGVTLGGGGVVQNSGVITGGQDGVDVAPGEAADITNAGTITGVAGVGVQLAGGSLTNEATGLIQGGTDGIIAGTGTDIVNAGTILDGVAPGHAGVVMLGSDTLTNLSGGTIAGAVGVLVTGDHATITDTGAIISTDGGDAIQVMPAADPAQITLGTGAKLTGTIDGGGTDGQITLVGDNTLPNTIANFGAGSALTVAPGASWIGTGNWTIASVNNTGTFQGGSLNTPLSLTGNFTSSGTLQVIVTPTVSTSFNITGTATLSGKLTYVFAPGTYVPGKTYDFLTAAGGASGEFTDVDYVGATPDYVSKTTHILIAGDDLGSNLVLGRVAPLDDSIFADGSQNAAIQAQAANDSLLGKANGSGDANAAACAAAESVMPDRTSPRGASTAAQMTSAVANAFCGAGGWIEATGSHNQIDGDLDAAGYSADDAGFLAGVDRPITGFGTRLGLAVGYDDSWLNDKSGGKASAGTVRVGLYAAQPLGRFTIAADALYGHANDTTTRQTGLAAAGTSFGSDIFSGGLEVNTGLDVSGVAVTPAAGVKIASVAAGSFAESLHGELAPFAVSGASSTYTSVQPFLNVGLAKRFITASLITITPEASVGYTLEAGDRGKSTNVIAPDGTGFESGHTELDAGGAQLQAGISAGKGNWALYAKYAAYLSGNLTAQTGEAGLQIKF